MAPSKRSSGGVVGSETSSVHTGPNVYTRRGRSGSLSHRNPHYEDPTAKTYDRYHCSVTAAGVKNEKPFYCTAAGISKDEYAEHWKMVKSEMEETKEELIQLKKELQEVIELFDKFYERDSKSLKGCPAKLQEAQERLRASDGDEQLEAAAQEEYTQVSKHMERLLNSLDHIKQEQGKVDILSLKVQWKIDEIDSALASKQGFLYDLKGEGYIAETIDEARNYIRGFSYYPHETLAEMPYQSRASWTFENFPTSFFAQ